LAGIEQRKVAAEAKLDPATLGRMEACGSKPVRGHAQNVERVIIALRKHGAEITEDGVRLRKPRR
jgi:hypothetical protein